MEGFEEVVPGVMVNKRRGFTVSIPHPDPAWVIRNTEETACLGDGQGVLYVFSSEELAKRYIEKVEVKGGFPKPYAWDELVDAFGKAYHSVLVDHTGEAGFYSNVPLRKGI